MADIIPGSPRKVQGWTLAASAERGRGFVECIAAAPFRNGIGMVMTITARATGSIGWQNDAWNLRVGQQIPIRLSVDGGGWVGFSAVVKERTYFAVDLPANSPLFGMVAAGNTMTLQIQNNQQAFSLQGTQAALSELTACVGRYSQTAQAPPAATPPAAAPQRPPQPAAQPRSGPSPGPPAKRVAHLPLQSGNYVKSTRSCESASEDSLMRVSTEGVSSPSIVSRFKEVVEITWKDFRVSQDHRDVQSGATSTTTLEYTVPTPSSFRTREGASLTDWRFCPVSSLPEALRIYADADRAVERRRESALRLQPGMTRVVFTDVEDTAGLGKVFPFLASNLGDGSGDRLLIALMRDEVRKIDFLILRAEGMMNCGTLGCGISVYVDEGSGYKHTISPTVHQPIYMMKSGTDVSLVFCTADQRDAFKRGAELKHYIEWPFRNHTFDVKGALNLPNPPGCYP